MSTKSIFYLNKLLANTYVIYNKTQNYHWNLKGSEFLPLHLLFQKHYEDYQEAVDEIAETIVMLGSPVEGKLSDMLKSADVSEKTVDFRNQKSIMEDLVKEHKVILKFIEEEVIDNATDAVVQDLLIKRIAFHRKACWMLEATLSH